MGEKVYQREGRLVYGSHCIVINEHILVLGVVNLISFISIQRSHCQAFLFPIHWEHRGKGPRIGFEGDRWRPRVLTLTQRSGAPRDPYDDGSGSHSWIRLHVDN